MALPLPTSSTEMMMSPQYDAEPDLFDATSVAVLSIGLLLVGVIAVLVGRPWRKTSLAPGSVRKPKQSPPPASRRAAARVHSTPVEVDAPAHSQRRVIRLHAITPGQTPYEYNVGDGTTGSAPSRAA